MIGATHLVVAVVAVLLGATGTLVVVRHQRAQRAVGAGRVRRILLPFTGTTISRRSLDAAFRLARTYRHALSLLLDEEPVDRVIVPAPEARNGLSGDDLLWLLEGVPAEVLILRPGFDDRRRVTGEAVKGHF